MVYVTKRQMKEALKRKRKKERYIDPAEQKDIGDYDKKFKKKSIFVTKRVGSCENCGFILFSPNYDRKSKFCENCLIKLKGEKLMTNGKREIVGEISYNIGTDKKPEYVKTGNIWKETRLDKNKKPLHSLSINMDLMKKAIAHRKKMFPETDETWANIGLIWLTGFNR